MCRSDIYSGLADLRFTLHLMQYEPAHPHLITRALIRFYAAKPLFIILEITNGGRILKENQHFEKYENPISYLREASHKIAFHCMSKHASWLNQIKIGFSILVKRFLKRNRLTSKENQKEKRHTFVIFFNQNMAKPYKWTGAIKLQAARVTYRLDSPSPE